jgi:tRNA threonylcarbamoyl adenosine modification protein (Sua5/YciO/YrdC/YwlC family)
MFIEINSYNIDSRLINQAVQCFKSGGIVIIPTDSVYAIGCDLRSKKGLQKLADFKGVKLNKANFSIICSDLSHLSDYTKQLDRSIFKLLKQCLPGPFTFILEASQEVPKLFDSNKKEIGIRIPNNAITLALVEALGNPIAVTSLHDEEDEIMEYFSDPSAIYERLADQVDFIIDGGYGNLKGSTIIDCTDGSPVVVREGLGILPN